MPPKQNKIRTEDDLNVLNLTEIGKEVGKDWKMLARHLGVPEPDIQQISHAYYNDLHEASFQALTRSSSSDSCGLYDSYIIL